MNPAMELASIILEDTQPPVFVIDECGPTLSGDEPCPGPGLSPIVGDMGEGILGERPISRVRHQAGEPGDGIDGRQFLRARPVGRLVGPMVCAAVTHVNDRPLERGPGFEGALAGDVFERPLHGNTPDVELFAVIAVLDDLGRVHKAVAGLDGIPAEAGPGFVGLLVANLERPRPGVVRHLNLPPEIGAVDDIAGMVLARDEGDRSAQGQVHADAHLAIV